MMTHLSLVYCVQIHYYYYEYDQFWSWEKYGSLRYLEKCYYKLLSNYSNIISNINQSGIAWLLGDIRKERRS